MTRRHSQRRARWAAEALLAGGALAWTVVPTEAIAADCVEPAREQAPGPGDEVEAAPEGTAPPPPGPGSEGAEPSDGLGPDSPVYTVPGTTPAAADERPPQSTAEALGRTSRRVKCLDETMIDEFGRARVRKGVQPRRFRKALRLALSLGGGAYAGDLLDTQWQTTGNLAFWFSEDFGLDAEFRLTPMTQRIERAATSFGGQNRYPDGVVENFAYIANAHFLWSPIHTKLRASEERIVHADFVVFAGGGPTFHDSVTGIGFDFGMSLYVYLTRFLSWRIDVGDHILGQESFGSRRISNNLVFNTGFGLWIPFRR